MYSPFPSRGVVGSYVYAGDARKIIYNCINVNCALCLCDF
jgi:hypothetical protein